MFGRLIDKQMGSGRFRAVSLEALPATTRRLRLPGSVRLTERIHSPRPGEGIETVVSLKGGTRLSIDTSDFIERQVFFQGAYEPEVARVIKEYLSNTSTAIDVGANVGIHTLTMAKVARAGRVIACEPHPGVRSRLITNLALNSIQNVRVIEKAIGDKAGVVSLHEPDDVANLGMSSLLPLGDWSAREVESTTLDDLVKSEGLGEIDLIKIDVEGLGGGVGGCRRAPRARSPDTRVRVWTRLLVPSRVPAGRCARRSQSCRIRLGLCHRKARAGTFERVWRAGERPRLFVKPGPGLTADAVVRPHLSELAGRKNSR